MVRGKRVRGHGYHNVSDVASIERWRSVLLAYSASGVPLRLLTLPSGEVTPLEVLASWKYALSRAYRREGWILLAGGEHVFALGLPLGASARLIATSFGAEPDIDPRRCWIGPDDNGTCTCLDPLSGTHQSVTMDARSHLEAVTVEGVVARSTSTDSSLRLHDLAGHAPRVVGSGRVLAVWRSLLAISDGDQSSITLLNLATSDQQLVERPAGSRRWGTVGAFSPDGDWLAVAVVLSDGRRPSPSPGEPFWAGATSDRETVAFINMSTRSVHLTGGDFPGAPERIVWLEDSTGIAFFPWFDGESIYFCRPGGAEFTRFEVRGGGPPPTPILDVTSLSTLT